MATFQDLQNVTLARLRAAGVNFGAAAANTPADVTPPYQLKLYLNLGYQEALSRSKDYMLAPVFVAVPSIAMAMSYPMEPLGAGLQSALQVHEVTYTQVGAQTRYIPYLPWQKFRSETGGYLGRFNSFNQLPRCWTQMLNRRQIDFYPGTSTGGDTIGLTITPNPQKSVGIAAALGGPLVQDADVPLIPDQFHLALVEYAVAQFCEQLNRQSVADRAIGKWTEYMDAMMDFGAAMGEGDPTQTVVDPYEIAPA